MRGLKRFIQNLRRCTVKEQEEKLVQKELGHIRSIFSKTSLSSYDKRKYVCKLVYIFLQGYNVDFGQMEALSLIVSTSYSDKRIGYLFISTFPSRKDYLLLAVECVKKDLHSNRPAIQKLALACLCNIGGLEMADLFTNQLISVIKNERNCDSVRQSAILGLVTFLREGKHYQLILEKEIPYLFMIFDDDNLSLVQSSATLLNYLSNNDELLTNLSRFEYLVIKKLQTLINTNVNTENNIYNQYVYGNFCSPWLIIQLLNLLNKIKIKENITNLVERIIEKCLGIEKNLKFIENNIEFSIFQQVVQVRTNIQT